MAPRDKKGILFILRAVMQSYLSVLCVHSRLANVLLRFNLDNKLQRGGGTESYVREQTLENQSRQLPESALSSRSPHEIILETSWSKHLNTDVSLGADRLKLKYRIDSSGPCSNYVTSLCLFNFHNNL